MSRSNKGSLTGIGYEGLTPEAMISRLHLRGVDIVVDVRLNAISRKRGFSKTALSNTLADAGIQYLHFRELGNAKENREGFGEPSHLGSMSRDRYEVGLRTQKAETALTLLIELSQDKHVALLCFEQHEPSCHRSLILHHINTRELLQL
jgi:uncharacterized protein (DUF488 family)